MALRSDYRTLRVEKWRLLVEREKWDRGLWEGILRQLAEAAPKGAHPETKCFRWSRGGEERDFYLKIYHRSRFPGSVKDLLRRSKSFRSLKQGLAMARNGFHVAVAVAAGEERRFRVLRRGFLLTEPVDGSSLPLYLRARFSPPVSRPALRKKRESLKKLAVELARLHEIGFVHGDLVPTNILVRDGGEGATFFYIDNDRTRRYPAWLRHRLWRRNLVQLNRFVLPGISLQDRMRFLKSYLVARHWERKEGRLARWLEKKTRRRRLECDRVAARVSFRELMRWGGPFTSEIN